jgi:Uma2 family endonuclease
MNGLLLRSRPTRRIGTRLVGFLESRLARRGIQVLYETGVHRPGASGEDYRIPDLVFFREPGLIVERGLEGAPLAVLEIRSPDDETYEKFAFWAQLGVQEIIVVVPEGRRVEVHRLAGSRYVDTAADAAGTAHAATIDVGFRTIPGDPPLLRVEHDGEAVDI